MPARLTLRLSWLRKPGSATRGGSPVWPRGTLLLPAQCTPAPAPPVPPAVYGGVMRTVLPGDISVLLRLITSPDDVVISWIVTVSVASTDEMTKTLPWLTFGL